MNPSSLIPSHSPASSRRAKSLLVAVCILAPSATFAAVTGVSGLCSPIDDMQPSLAMNYLIRIQGDANHLGEIIPFAGSFAPGGWALAQGQLMVVNQNPDLAL